MSGCVLACKVWPLSISLHGSSGTHCPFINMGPLLILANLIIAELTQHLSCHVWLEALILYKHPPQTADLGHIAEVTI